MNTAQQIGAALGLAILTTISTTAADTRLPDADTALGRGLGAGDRDLVARAQEALAYGYTNAYLAAAVALVLAAVIATLVITTSRRQSSADDATSDSADGPRSA